AVGHDGGAGGRMDAPALPARERSPTVLAQPTAGDGQGVASHGISAAKRLKADAALVVSVRLIACQGDKVFARMPEPLLEQLRPALAQAVVTEDKALTTPPWESALLEMQFRDGQVVFGQLVRGDVLRMNETRWCEGEEAQGGELRLDDGPSLFPWFKQHLGPVQAKEHQLLREPPPSP
ncbi:hypothetical protein, partial [Corallococcus sp. CA041A]